MDDFSTVDFNFSFAPGVLDEQVLGFELAGDVWSQYLNDTYKGEDLQINIHVQIGDDILPDKVVGGAFPAIETGIAYRDVYRALHNDVTTKTDEIAVDSLLDVKKLPVLVGGDITYKNPEMQATRANLKALGLLEGDASELDGYIVMNSLVNADSVSWNYNYLEEPQEGELDFFSVALHEIGHNIGFVSGVDIQGWNEQSADFDAKGAVIDHMATMDLFRYSLESFAAKDGNYTMSINDLTFGRAAYFSIDRTADNAIAMSTGADYQGSHWANGDRETGMGIMNPTIRLGERWEISENDLTVFDAIGWDVNYSAKVDLDELFSKAQSKIDHAPIVERTSEVDEIFSGEAYHWAWASTGGSSATSSGWWATGYWSTYNSDTLSTDTSSNDGSDILGTDANNANNLVDNEPSILEEESLNLDASLEEVLETNKKEKKEKKE